MSATLVLRNGRIHTLDPEQPTATAIAIQNDAILAVGDDEAMRALLGPDGEEVDLDGRGVTPGLVDAHVHFQWYSLSLQQIDLFEVPSLEEALRRVAAFLKENPPASPPHNWLQGRGWNQDLWTNRQFPTAAHLDKVAAHIPICLQHKSGHAAWVNSRALHLAGINKNTPDPPGGQIQRDQDGRPTGVLFEDAIKLVTDQIPPPTTAQIVAAMRVAQEKCWRLGLTGLHDFDRRDSFIALQTMRQNGELGLRVVKNLPVERLDHIIGVGLRSGFGDDWLRIGGVKIFADGALGPRTAAMIEPYEGEPHNYGIVVTDKEVMKEKVSQASAAGLSVTIHAIGDRANHDVLDVYEAVRAEEKERGRQGKSHPLPATPLRHRIEHVQIIHPDDRDRLAELNVIASMQPTHATSDMEMADRYWGDRAKYSYAFRTMLETGATLAFGSDAPIEDIAPLPGLYAAVTRRRSGGAPGPDGWYPEQRLALEEAVRAFTWGPAFTAGQEDRLGTLTPGKLADLTIYDRDIFAIPTDELEEVQIAGAVIGGVFKYRAW